MYNKKRAKNQKPDRLEPCLPRCIITLQYENSTVHSAALRTRILTRPLEQKSYHIRDGVHDAGLIGAGIICHISGKKIVVEALLYARAVSPPRRPK